MKTLVIAIIAGAATTAAAVTPIGPFTGTLQESWEGFMNYADDPAAYMTDPSVIMAGAAQISNPSMVVYQPGYADFGLGDYGSAQVVDGIHGHGVNNGFPAVMTAIDFYTPIVEFGGYWGAAGIAGDPTIPTSITFDFFDAGGGLIDSAVVAYSDPSATGTLIWFGWQSDIPVSRIEYTGDFVVNDYLQANVPAPASIALLGLGGFLATRRR